MNGKHANRGDKIRRVLTAQQFNAFVDVSNWFRTHAKRLGAGDGKTPWDYDRVLVRNTSSVDVGQHAAMAMREPIFTPTVSEGEFSSSPKFDIDLPDEPTAIGKFCITAEPILAGACGMAVASGVVQSYVLKVAGEANPLTVDVLGELPTQVGQLLFLHPAAGGGAQVLWMESDDYATVWEGDEGLGDVLVGYKLHRAIVRFGVTENAAAPGSLFEVTGGQLKEGGGAVECYRLDENGARDGDPENVNPSPHDTGAAAVGPFRGVAFPAESDATGLRGDVIEAMRVGESWVAFGSGRTSGTGTADEDIAAEATGDITVDTADSRTVGIVAYALQSVSNGAVVQWAWNGPMQRFDVWAVDTWAIFEVTEDLTEGDDDGAAAYVLDAGGARSGSLITIYPSPYSDLPAPAQVGKVGPFRGVAFAAQGSTLGLRGDVVHAIYHEGQWIALGSGRTAGSGVATEVGRPGSDITVALNENDNREITVVARCLCTIPADAIVQVVWNGLMRRWDATSPCRPDDDDELPDPGDPENPPGGGGGGPGGGGSGPCGCGLPPGVECSPLECCPEDDTGLTVTDCEEFATAPEEYYVEVPSLTCVPDCATGNEPDETSGLPPRRVALTHQAGTCTWLSEVFDCGDGVEWQWELVPSLDGRSWLRLYKDAVAFLQWQTNDAWCPRCANDVEIYCPPDECTDLTERLCVKSVCTNCADGICYTVDNPSDWDVVSSEEFIWSGASGNTGVGVTDAAEGRPAPPSRRITLVYGHLTGEVDGAAVVETFPGIAFDPTTCGVDLDGVCGIELSVKVQSDESVGDRGVRVGIAIKQGADSFVATIGSARLADGWKTFAVNRLLAADFDKVTATGMDDTTHPDWTTPGAAMTFGVCLWQEDGTVDDAFGDAITVVANWDILRLCLESEPCTGDPASYVCPDAVTIAACEEADATTEQNVAFTNTGDSPFTLVSVAGAGALETACGDTVTVDIDGFLGPLAPGETRNITITVDRTTPVECDGALTIVTNLAGSEVCVVPVTIVVLAAEDCDADDPCSLFHHDERDYAVDPATPLGDLVVGDMLPSNDGNLTYSATLLECDITDGSIETAEAVENETGVGGATFNSSTNLSGNRAVIQLIDDMPANYALKAVCSADLSPNYTHAIGIAFGVAAANDWWAVVTTKFMLGGPSFSGFALLRQAPGAALSIVDNYFTGSSTGTMVCGIHVLGNRAKIVLEDGVTVASASLLNSSQVDKDFGEVQLTGTGVGLLRTNGEPTAQGANGSYWGELCITDQPGLVPPWEVDP